MYNRILNRPMFKRGGDVIDSQGSGITSGLDTPRSNYLGGGTIGGGTIHGNPIGNRTGFEGPKINKEPIRNTEVTSEQYSSNALDAFASGFLNPKARTMGEALFYTNEARKSGIKPLEEQAAERKFEFEKIPLETESGAIIAEASKRELDVHAKRTISDEADTLYKEAMASGEPVPEHIKKKYEALKVLALGNQFYTMSRALELAEEVYGTKAILENMTAQQIEDAKADFIKTLTGNRWIQPERKEGATGGRIGYQQGIGPNVMQQGISPNVMQTNLQENIQTPGEDVSISEQIDTENVPDSGPQGSGLGENSQAYALLRARLPEEITDDIVMLIAYNPVAFEDFAAIKTQADVMDFNMKYGVELVIPAQDV